MKSLLSGWFLRIALEIAPAKTLDPLVRPWRTAVLLLFERPSPHGARRHLASRRLMSGAHPVEQLQPDRPLAHARSIVPFVQQQHIASCPRNTRSMRQVQPPVSLDSLAVRPRRPGG